MLGLIEVVQNAQTIARIQAKLGLTGVIREGTLFSWMEKLESDPER